MCNFKATVWQSAIFSCVFSSEKLNLLLYTAPLLSLPQNMQYMVQSFESELVCVPVNAAWYPFLPNYNIQIHYVSSAFKQEPNWPITATFEEFIVFWLNSDFNIPDCSGSDGTFWRRCWLLSCSSMSFGEVSLMLLLTVLVCL